MKGHFIIALIASFACSVVAVPVPVEALGTLNIGATANSQPIVQARQDANGGDRGEHGYRDKIQLRQDDGNGPVYNELGPGNVTPRQDDGNGAVYNEPGDE